MASMSGPARLKYDAEYAPPPAATDSAAGIGPPRRSNVQVTGAMAPVGSVIVYDGFAGPGVPSWQLMHFALKTGCTCVSQPTPTTSVADAGLVLIRWLRGVVPNSELLPATNASS